MASRMTETAPRDWEFTAQYTPDSSAARSVGPSSHPAHVATVAAVPPDLGTRKSAFSVTRYRQLPRSSMPP